MDDVAYPVLLVALTVFAWFAYSRLDAIRETIREARHESRMRRVDDAANQRDADKYRELQRRGLVPPDDEERPG